MRDGTIITLWFTAGSHVVVNETFSVGKGRVRRRRIGAWVYVPAAEANSLADVLRAAAAQMELPLSERYLPPS